MQAILHFDGSCMKNPGGIGSGAAILKVGNQRYEISQFLEVCTSNEAEYTGIIIGVRKALELGVTKLDCYGDSQLVIKQLRGEYKVKAENLQSFWKTARQLASKLSSCDLHWIRRELNLEADELASKCVQLSVDILPALKRRGFFTLHRDLLPK